MLIRSWMSSPRTGRERIASRLPIRVVVGMTGRFARQQIKERERRFRRKHRWRLRALKASLALVALSIWLIAPGLEVPLWAVVPAMFVCVLGAASDQLMGTYSLACGRDAEKWTSDELRRTSPQGSRVVDWIPFGGPGR